jgi:hypothetical protein
MTWANKWKEAGEAALEYIGTKEELRGHHAAMKVLHILPGREEERGAIIEEKIVAIGSNDKARERAGEKSRVWELHDQRLLHKAALSNGRVAAGTPAPSLFIYPWLFCMMALTDKKHGTRGTLRLKY